MRTILHSDLNAFYASVECLYNPRLNEVPMAVCGDPQARHGIILTKNERAKKYGVKTGEAIWQARQKCPGLVTVPVDMDKYVRYSRLMRDIYADYTDRIEPFGMDEAWLDISGDNGKLVADEIRQRARKELGITASIGVADNKIFAKLGSDMQKPDATTVITPDNFRQKVWPLSVGELLYVGPATLEKLRRRGVFTIGMLATSDAQMLRAALGKPGEMLHAFANGQDRTPVAQMEQTPEMKSIGNSTTAARDIVDDDDAKWVLVMLSEMVGARLRENRFRGSEVQIWVRDCKLFSFERQVRLAQPTDIDAEIVQAAMALFRQHYGWAHPVRSLGVRVGQLSSADDAQQLSLFDDTQREKRRALNHAIDGIRRRYGDASIICGALARGTSAEKGVPLAQPPHKDYKPFETRPQG